VHRLAVLRPLCGCARRRRISGSDIEGAEPLVTQLEASERYQEAVAEWVLGERPETADAVLALTEFVGVIAADKLVGDALREVGPVSEEKDALHQIIAFEAIGEWLSGPAQREWLDRRQAAYGPSGMAPQETRVAEATPITAAQLAELRALAEALAADNSAPLPAGDAGLIEAERRHRESRRRCHALYDQFNINPEAEDEIIIAIIDPTEDALLNIRREDRACRAGRRHGQASASHGR